MPTYTTDALISSIRRRGMLPSSGDALDETDLLALANEELQTYCVDFLLGFREEYLVADYDVEITAGKADYRLPERAIAGKLRSLSVSTDGGTTWSDPLVQVEPEREAGFASGGTERPLAYKFQGGDVVLLPTPTTTGAKLRMSYYRRPNDLVLLARCGTVSHVVNANTLALTATVPANIVNGSVVDFILGRPSFDWLAIDYTVGTASGTSISFINPVTLPLELPAPLATGASVFDVHGGDYVALAGESPVPQIPVELHPLLAQRVTCRALEALGSKSLGAAEKTLERMRHDLTSVFTERNEAAKRPVVNRYGPGRRGR